ncbi:MAG: hypothetical protein KZQ73_02055 [Candidatus Thiodiazotropha sp. (ex Semelilucina semeliformis)]|nr:hypothetical protein [Candidatus Thiodiazotropha sp. (ex Semelilucina semeliformis)]
MKINMDRYSTYIWFLIFAGLATGATPFIGDLLLAQNYGTGEIPSFELAKFKAYAGFAAFIENIVCAIWLMTVSNRNIALRVVWTVFGLVYGLWAIAINYLLKIHEELVSGSKASVTKYE